MGVLTTGLSPDRTECQVIKIFFQLLPIFCVIIKVLIYLIDESRKGDGPSESQRARILLSRVPEQHPFVSASTSQLDEKADYRLHVQLGNTNSLFLVAQGALVALLKINGFFLYTQF